MASYGDALVDSLELAWKRVEPAVLAATAFYTYSHRVEDYVELARLARGHGFRGAPRLMVLAAGMAGFMGSLRWYLVYTRLLKYERPPKPSSLDPELLEDIEYALTQTIYSNGVYNAFLAINVALYRAVSRLPLGEPWVGRRWAFQVPAYYWALKTMVEEGRVEVEPATVLARVREHLRR